MQTWLMRIGGGLAIVPFAAAILFALIKSPRTSAATAPLKTSLIWSLVLFGAEQVLRGTEQIAAMGLMGLGGLVAVAGGLLFIVVVLRSVWTPSTSRS